ncbi:TPA: phage protein NinX family protein [Enterobacter hormaechei]
MDYSQLSDFEINKLVANATGTQVEETYQFVNGGEDIADHMSGIVLLRKITSNWKHWKIYDPCNSPSDAWPIIVDNKIKIEPVRRVRNYNEWYEEWDASVNSPHFCESHKNPLRAAMIVFLLSQDAKHA